MIEGGAPSSLRPATLSGGLRLPVAGCLPLPRNRRVAIPTRVKKLPPGRGGIRPHRMAARFACRGMALAIDPSVHPAMAGTGHAGTLI